MAPTVRKVKTAFLYYQGEQLALIRNELGLSMGDAMTELSRRWRLLPTAERKKYEDMEAEDRVRFERESAIADEEALKELEARRAKFCIETDADGTAIISADADTTSRGARQRIQQEREIREAERERRKREAWEALDPEERAERERQAEAKKRETEERRRKRREREDAMEAQHTKLDKEAQKKASQRLEYLLKQSSIFAKLQGKGGESLGTQQEKKQKAADKAAKGGSKKRAAATATAASSAVAGKGGSPSGVHHVHDASSPDEDEIDEEADEDAVEEHVFLQKQPSTIKFGKLKEYQLEALNWMIHLSEKGLNGILADEMGLGKTLQSISILAYQFEYRRSQGPHLICVPKSTLSNWMNELRRWCPVLRVIKFHGSREEREYMIDNFLTMEAAAHDGKRPDKQVMDENGELVDDNSDNPRSWDVCVTTYEVANNEVKTLQKFAWQYLVIDEAHRLKNDASMFSKTVRSFNTSNRLLLTGTPLQNNLHELWALLNFLLPDIFSSAEQFDEWFDLEIDDEDAKKQMISQLHKILRPFMLRRLKADVAKGLPPKSETILMVGMSKMQKQLYKKLLLRDLDSITGNITGKNRTAVLNIVMQLRKCCGHPYLFEGVEDRRLDPLGEHLVDNCGKLSMVDKLLKRLKERGDRVLIFTQMTRILDILEDFMVMRGYKYCRIDGNTNYEDRESAIDEFNREGSEKFCFILSTRAGGLGINLQTANCCILYDSDWNPQQDLQAQDRCHRLGQKKPVTIFRLVTENTVEEKIVERAQQKLKLDAMVVQQGRLKEKDKVTKEEIMAAVRFGADTIFRSEESTITDEDIDVILEKGAAKTKELANKIQKADKGDLLDFRLDGGIATQTFEGIDYSDKELRDHLRMLAADSMGKRERRPPPKDYQPIIQSKKSMLVNNKKIKLPKALRIPSMEDHHFYNRERLLELGKLEFETYAALREMGQLPPREIVERQRSLLPPELAQEKLELLAEGFGEWTRSQYYHFVKACAKFGRDDIANIASDMDMQEEAVAAYSEAFWKYGPTELKDDWERVTGTIERGEKKIAKQKKLSALLKQFVETFDDPRNEMVFANKGTTHFALEQDRALLTAVNKCGYGNWDSVREEIRTDSRLRFQHSVQGMTVQAIAKRIDYRMRQMEKELEAREKSLKNKRPPNVVAAHKAIDAIKEMDFWDMQVREGLLEGEEVPDISTLSHDARLIMEDRLKDRSAAITRVREIEVQVQRCMNLAEETRQSIFQGAQYVNYSSITLRSGGVATADKDESTGMTLKDGIELEAKINAEVLKIQPCRQCESCTTSNTKLCAKRLQVRKRMMEEETSRFIEKMSPKKAKKRKMGEMSQTKTPPDSASSSFKPRLEKVVSSSSSVNSASACKKQMLMKTADGQLKPRITSQGNKRMAIPEELFPEFCQLVTADGVWKRDQLVSDFVSNHPTISMRQVNMKLAEITTRNRPDCVSEPRGKVGRAVTFYLRPRYYKYLEGDQRPRDWERYAEADEALWEREQAKKKEDRKKAEELRKKQKLTMSSTSMEDISSRGGDTDVDVDIDVDDDASGPPPMKKARVE